MKKILFWLTIVPLLILAWCDNSHNFMDVNNPNAKEDLINLVWSWNIPKINTDNIILDNLSWTRDTAKGYANKYYEDTFGEYVDKAKYWLSWAKETVKWFYNDSVDDLNQMISDKANSTISWELNKFKIK